MEKTLADIQKTLIVVAGGKGERMQSKLPKQFIELMGKPILMHTLEVFYGYDSEMQIVLVLPESQFDYWNELCEKHAFAVPHRIAAGGSTRFQSVCNGLSLAPDEGLIAVHDGVRPLVATSTIHACLAEAATSHAAIPVTEVVESLREIKDSSSIAVNRANYKLVQTPQVFDAQLLKQAYLQPYKEGFTDDASVVEAFGAKVSLVPGNRENIKITNPNDLKIASTLLPTIKPLNF